jgi:hypothetical protein
MSSQKTRRSLEDVLNDYVASEHLPNHEALKKWVLLYPEYRKELTEFTVNWGRMEHLPHVPTPIEVSEDTLVLRAMSIVEDRLYVFKSKGKASAAVIVSLLEEGKNFGLDVSKFAAQCRVSVPIMLKLSRRFIDFTSIPSELLESLAAAINTTAQSITAYLKQPALADGMRFSSKTKPALANQENFFDAVRNDQAMDNETREYWLLLEPKSTPH